MDDERALALRIEEGDRGAAKELLRWVDRGHTENCQPILDFAWRHGELRMFSMACLRQALLWAHEDTAKAQWAIWCSYTAGVEIGDLELVIRILTAADSIRKRKTDGLVVLTEDLIDLRRFQDFQPGKAAWAVWKCLQDKDFWPPRDLGKECVDGGYLVFEDGRYRLGPVCPPLSELPLPPVTWPKCLVCGGAGSFSTGTPGISPTSTCPECGGTRCALSHCSAYRRPSGLAGLLEFEESTEETVTFRAPLQNDQYMVTITTDTGDLPMMLRDKSYRGFTIACQTPYTGRVAYLATYPASAADKVQKGIEEQFQEDMDRQILADLVVSARS